MNVDLARARCWVEVDLDVVASNYRWAREICGEDVRIIPVLKANAYGLGAAALSRALLALGARLFAVAELNEALEIRRACGGDALVLGMVAPSQMETAVDEGVMVTVYDLDQARRLSAAAQRVGRDAEVHVKLDTGLHRLGFAPDDMEGIEAVFGLPRIRVEGLFTHLALREDSADAVQIKRLLRVAEALKRRGRDFGLLHACDSIGMVRHPQWRFDAVRIGAWLYGVVPSRFPNARGECMLPLRFMTRVTQVRAVAKGEYLGYDEEHPLDRERVIATLSAGYADGYPRVNSVGEVVIRGKRAPVAGLLCMDQMTVDVTDIPDVRPGDAVTLLGDGISLAQYSAWTGAHRNEALTRIGRRVPRIYIRSGEAVEVAGMNEG
ncbi:MAG: alanine racemase [Clostridia bacterium]|nr:alanine racemase [Clostridia bacterium]